MSDNDQQYDPQTHTPEGERIAARPTQPITNPPPPKTPQGEWPEDSSQQAFDRHMNDNVIPGLGEQFGEHLREQAQSPDPVGHAMHAVASQKRKRLSSVAARKRRAQRDATFEFDLPNTLDEDDNPTTALCRKPEIFDLDELSQLPNDLSNRVWSLIEATEKAEGDGEDVQGMGVADLAKRHLGSAAALADACVLRGFVDPKVYATEAEADAHGGVWVKDIDSTDRMNFFNFCQGSQREASATVAGFRDEPVDAARAGLPGEAVPETRESERDPAAGGPVST